MQWASQWVEGTGRFKGLEYYYTIARKKQRKLVIATAVIHAREDTDLETNHVYLTYIY